MIPHPHGNELVESRLAKRWEEPLEHLVEADGSMIIVHFIQIAICHLFLKQFRVTSIQIGSIEQCHLWHASSRPLPQSSHTSLVAPPLGHHHCLCCRLLLNHHPRRWLFIHSQMLHPKQIRVDCCFTIFVLLLAGIVVAFVGCYKEVIVVVVIVIIIIIIQPPNCDFVSLYFDGHNLIFLVCWICGGIRRKGELCVVDMMMSTER